jgi:tetratricopeptide (TPR) repeat protein
LTNDAAQAFERALEYCVTDEQRLLVLSRLAIALQMCGRWEQSREVLRKARQLQAKTAPNATIHDDVELALFETRWRAGLKQHALLDDLNACARANDASPSHRVACGLFGLKVAAELGKADAMEEFYVVIAPFLKNPTINPATALEVEVIYLSVCGDLQKAEEAADHLRKAVRDERDPRTLSRALGNVGVAYRLAGRVDDAEAVFREMLDLSLAHGLLSRTSFAMLGLIRVYLARGDVSRARASMKKLDALTEADQDSHHFQDRCYCLIKLALEEGNIEEASNRYASLAAEAYSSSNVNVRAAFLALGIRIALQRRDSIEQVQPMVAELEAAHLQNRSCGEQDSESHALALSLRYCGKPEAALRLLSEYVTTYRREQWPLPQSLSDLLRELRGSNALSATPGMEPLSVS